jgi:uncharacterized membrane protein
MEQQVSTHADAPTDDVWRLFVDLERWPELTESLSEVRRLDSGPLAVGSEATVKQASGRQARWRVTGLEPGRSFTWESKAGLVTIIGVHTVAPDSEGSTITLGLGLRGPLSGVVGALTSRSTVKNITMELEGFRRAAESEHA